MSSQRRKKRFLASALTIGMVVSSLGFGGPGGGGSQPWRPNEDDHGGERFCNHVTRRLTTQWMRDKNSPAQELLR